MNYRRSKSEKIVIWVFFCIFVLYAVTLLFPAGWCLLNSFKLQQEFMQNNWGLPQTFTMQNWIDAVNVQVEGTTLVGMFANSIILIIGCSLCSIGSSAVTAYCLAKYKFRGKDFFYALAVVLMMIPATGSTAAVYRFFNVTGLYDTYLCILILNLGGFGTGFLLLYGFFKNLSWSFAEAAFVDGAGHFTIFFRIMLPMAIPGLGAVAILTCIGIWNDYYTVYMYAPTKITIAYGLQRLVAATSYQANFPLLFAVMILSMIPVILVFCAFQKTILNNTVTGGLKG